MSTEGAWFIWGAFTGIGLIVLGPAWMWYADNPPAPRWLKWATGAGGLWIAPVALNSYVRVLLQ